MHSAAYGAAAGVERGGPLALAGPAAGGVLAAHRAGATIFFAPYIKPTKEILKYEEGHLTNYQMAKKAAKKYAPGMKVVPVTSFDEAVKYLQTHK